MVPTTLFYFSFSLFSLGILHNEHKEESLLNSYRSINKYRNNSLFIAFIYIIIKNLRI